VPGSVVVVSHAAAVVQNRAVYATLAASGEDVRLVAPSRWRDAYAPSGYDVPGDVTGGLPTHRVPVVGTGRPQRHAYVVRSAALLRRLSARIVLIEEEPFSVAAAQWARAARRCGVPYGVQLAETIARDLPRPVERWRDAVLRGSAVVLARSPGAAALATRWGATGEVAVVPHDVEVVPARPRPNGAFTVAYVGRLVEEKGVGDLLAAIAQLDDARLVVAGAGPLAPAVEHAGDQVEYLGPLRHDRVGDVFARAHVTCVPSRTTQRWEEQFGRVAVESLVRGVPVVATSTGALPWVLTTAGGGVTVPQRDPSALAAALAALRDDADQTASLGAAGREGVRTTFSTEAVTQQLSRLLARVSAG
jgi:glycosyltransferase involved in cell wall biosynthesis